MSEGKKPEAPNAWVDWMAHQSPATVIACLLVIVLGWIGIQFNDWMRDVDRRTKSIETNQLRIMDKMGMHIPELSNGK